jgi:pimeloyl-ACP methyl ester carboxylesterase
MSNVVPSDALKPNRIPTPDQIGQRTPVILVHGLGESAGNWSDGGDMLSRINSLNGTGPLTESVNGIIPLRFDYTDTHFEWVDNSSNGPALAFYIKHVAAVFKKARGPGKVVIVAFSARHLPGALGPDRGDELERLWHHHHRPCPAGLHQQR